MTEEFLGTTREFVAPSGFKYSIREQNGDDEDILSNIHDARTMANFTKFIAAIVVNTDATPNGKLTFAQAEDLPLLDRYCIIFQSRMHSIGNNVEFDYTWPGETNPLHYVQDLEEMIFTDYSNLPTEEELEAKPNAIPYYPHGKNLKDIKVTLASGKQVLFDVLTGKSESWLATLPENKRSRNTEILAHNPRLLVEGKFEVIENFRLFSVKDMMELRSAIQSYDPEFTTMTDICNPLTGEMSKYAILTAPDFFFPSER